MLTNKILLKAINSTLIILGRCQNPYGKGLCFLYKARKEAKRGSREIARESYLSAFNLFGKSKEPDNKLAQIEVARELFMLGNEDEAEKRLCAFYNEELKSLFYSEIAFDMAKKKDFDRALEMLSEIKDNSLQAEAAIKISHILFSEGLRRRATDLLNKCEKIAITTVDDRISLFCRLSKKQFIFGNKAKANQLLNRALEELFKIDRWALRWTQADTVAGTAIRIGRDKAALDIAQKGFTFYRLRIQDTKRTPKKCTYRFIIDRNLSWIARIYASLGNVENIIEIGNYIRNPDVRDRCFASAGYELLKAGREGDAREVIGLILNNYKRLFMYIRLASLQSKFRNVSYYCELVGIFKNMHVTINGESMAEIYRQIAFSLHRIKPRCKEANQYMEKAYKLSRNTSNKNNYRRIWSLNFARIGDLSKSLKIVNNINDPVYKLFTLEGINDSYKYGLSLG